jgi:hypothetical protein
MAELLVEIAVRLPFDELCHAQQTASKSSTQLDARAPGRSLIERARKII